jgi:predicted amidohydrolase YtcJ
MKLLWSVMLCSMIAGAQEASLAVVHARVWTGNPAHPWAEALASNGNTILAVGDTAAIQKLITPRTRVLDARGGMVTPGFIDSHVHFLQGGLSLRSVQLRGARSKAEFVARIKAFAETAPPGTWITGGDWDHQNWGGELPQKEWIDAATPKNPVWINRMDGHMSLANSLALAAAQVGKSTREVEGGAIVRYASGEPTGILKDNAKSLVDRVMPALSAEMMDRALDAAMKYVAEGGVTSVVHMGTWDDLEVFRRARKDGRLRTRIRAAVPLSTWERLAQTVAREGRGDDFLSIGCLKAFVDGSLGSHTAAFLEPFTDAPKDTGLDRKSVV